MPNDYENPKYTNKNEYHAGDGPCQFPWWAIVSAFVVWWPLGLVFIGLNAAMKNGRLGGFAADGIVFTVGSTYELSVQWTPRRGCSLCRWKSICA